MKFMSLALTAPLLLAATTSVLAQAAPNTANLGSGAWTAPRSDPSHAMLDRMAAIANPGNGVWTAEQVATMGRLRDAALKDTYAYDQLTYLTDSIGPRPSGSLQAQAAVERVAAQMRALGAVVTLEKTSVSHWVRGDETAALTAWEGMTPGTTQKIVLTALGNSVPTPAAGLTRQIVVVNSFAELKALPPGALEGRIVLFNYPFDKELAAAGQGLNAYAQSAVYRVAGPSIAASLGAAAVLVRSVGSADFRLPHTGVTFFVEGVKPVPAAAVTSEDAELLSRLTRRGPVTLHLQLTPKTLQPATSYNVIADWKGSEHPEQIVLVSGHLDSWDLGTGAIDDGAGVVIAMQAIHMMKVLDIHPRRTIRLVAWMDEELGSPGAATYLHDHAGDLANHVAVMETDMGSGRPFGITVSGVPALAAYFAPVARTLEPIGAASVNPGDEIGEDVGGILASGAPGWTPTQDLRFYFNYHHTAADTLDKVDPVDLAKNATVAAVTAYALADAAQPPPRSK
ncbi:MAG: M20/M25/M40 family metallo-hydrolase [Caulobacteraceae bacterium]